MGDVYPFAKDRKERLNELQAITFDEEGASDAQKIAAPPKQEIGKIRFFGVTKHVFKKLPISKNETRGIV